ncbi:helix-turn-helix domain-containing protein [Planctomycetes bacterium Poly30]|uniref:helix-turn-helix transcriptional regulator n=1 Tax=Saltatorellus ferox TaxID=2528018 RepID=UPI0011A5DF9C
MKPPESAHPRAAVRRTPGGDTSIPSIAHQGEAVQPLLLPAPKVAEMLGVSKRQIAGLRSSGRLPSPVRLGRSVRWRREEIEAWIAAGCPTRDRWDTRSNRGGKS